MTKKPSELQAKLKKADPEIRHYVAELQSENAKLQRRIAKLEAQKITSDNRIEALEKEMEENKPQVHFNLSGIDREA